MKIPAFASLALVCAFAASASAQYPSPTYYPGMQGQSAVAYGGQPGPSPGLQNRIELLQGQVGYDPVGAPVVTNDYYIEEPQDVSSVEAGVSLYLLKPVWETNPSFYTGNGPTPGTSPVQNGREFDWDLELAPKIWIGYNGNSFGGRISYFTLDGDTNDNFTVPAGQSAASARPFERNLPAGVGPGTAITSSHDLEIDVLDLEATKILRRCNWQVLGSAGIRILSVEQSYNITGNDPAVGVERLSSQHDFDGLGPTLSIEGRRMFGNLSVFGIARQSLLFGDRDATVTQVTAGNMTNIRTQNNDGVVSMTELELGVEYAREMGGLRPFIQGAFVGQFLTGVGNGANGDLFTLQRDQNMGLIGGRVTFGLEF